MSTRTEIIPLGTASAIPTRERNLSAMALWREGRILLFDCGEGTQHQMMRAGLRRTHLDVLLITHFHGDHLYGVMGLLATLALLRREEPLLLVGPEGLEGLVSTMPGLARHELPFPTEYIELREGFGKAVVLDTPTYRVEARPVVHRTFTLGFRYKEKDRPGHLDPERARALGVTDYPDFRRLKAGEDVVLADGRLVASRDVVGPSQPGATFAYVTDTQPCENGVLLARDADLLYHEATFGDAYQARAVETGHSTARQAAEVAREAGAKKLLLGHFSARYKDVSGLVSEARAVFQNTEAAEELKRYVLEAAPATSAEDA